MENTKQTQYHAAAYVRLSKEDLNSVSGLKAESNSISKIGRASCRERVSFMV